jgi:hypothetical protein
MLEVLPSLENKLNLQCGPLHRIILDFEYLRGFKDKFETALGFESEDLVGLIHGKNQRSKISWDYLLKQFISRLLTIPLPPTAPRGPFHKRMCEYIHTVYVHIYHFLPGSYAHVLLILQWKGGGTCRPHWMTPKKPVLGRVWSVINGQKRRGPPAALFELSIFSPSGTMQMTCPSQTRFFRNFSSLSVNIHT